MRDFEVNSISVNDVLYTLRELDRDGKYEGMLEQFLTFASELTGISVDTLADKLYEGRQNDGQLKIVDSYGLNDGGMIYSIELAENRFVDVKAMGTGLIYIMDNEDGSTVYTGEWKADGTCPGYEYDEKEVVRFVKNHIKEQEIEKIGNYFASVNLGDYGLDWCEFTREDYELLYNEMADRNLSVEKVVHEFLLGASKALVDGVEDVTKPQIEAQDVGSGRVQVFQLNEVGAGGYPAGLKFWSNSMGYLCEPGGLDIEVNELPMELFHACFEVEPFERFGSRCSLVQTDQGYGIALANEYDAGFAKDLHISLDDLFSYAVKDAERIAGDPTFENAMVLLGKSFAQDDSHELIVVVPADIEREEFERIAKRLDEMVYQAAYQLQSGVDKLVSDAEMRCVASQEETQREREKDLEQSDRIRE